MLCALGHSMPTLLPVVDQCMLRRLFSGLLLGHGGSRLWLQVGCRGLFWGKDGLQLPLQALQHLLGILCANARLCGTHRSPLKSPRSSRHL